MISTRLTVPVFTSLQSSVVKMFWLLWRAAWIVSSSTAVEKTLADCTGSVDFCGAQTRKREWTAEQNGVYVTVASCSSKQRKHSVATLSRKAFFFFLRDGENHAQCNGTPDKRTIPLFRLLLKPLPYWIFIQVSCWPKIMPQIALKKKSLSLTVFSCKCAP